MDPKLKTVLAVVVGVVIGMTLLGGAFASHAVMRTVAFGAAANQGYGMMDQRQGFDAGQGMMGPRGGQYGAPDAFGGCPNGEVCPGGTCPDAGQGMMGPRGGYQRGPQDGTGVCPNGGACPSVTEDATTEL
jgi:hypothetical protein